MTLTRRRMMQGCACMTTGLLTSLLSPAAHAALRNDCKPPQGLPAPLHDIVARAFAGIEAASLWDVHAHLLGTGDSGSGCSVHASLVQGWQVVERVRHRAILNAACVDPRAESIDRAYAQRLLTLAQGFPVGARWMLFAFDQAHDDAGRALPGATTFHVPNTYAAHIAAQHPDRFAWVASIHPYRDDALVALNVALVQGALAVKWLPSAMNIDVRDPRLDAFYAKLAATRTPLIVHVGEEKAVPGAERHDLGNPLHLRVPLSHGVRVIAAHCASLGQALDLDARRPSPVPAFNLFARLMDEASHGGRLLGDVSAVFQSNRDVNVWHTVIQRTEWHPRLLHGSDHPLPGVMALHRPAAWVRARLLSREDANHIDALRHHNPLLADLVLKRMVRSNGVALSTDVFNTRRHFHHNSHQRPPLVSVRDTQGRPAWHIASTATTRPSTSTD